MKKTKRILLATLACLMIGAGALGMASCEYLNALIGSLSSQSTSSPSNETNSSDNTDQSNLHKHSYTETVTVPTCTEQGYTTYTCSCGDSYIDDYVNANGHTEVIDQAVDPTCTETGLTEGKHCSVCSTVLVAQETVKASGHTEVVDKAVDPTCTDTGLTEGKHCSVCSTVLVSQETVKANGHNYVDDICDNCGTEYYSEGLKYTLNSDGVSYSVTVGSCTDTNIVIPSTYQDLPVTSIGSSAFYYCDSLTSVEIPDSVTEIGYEAFYSCWSLTSVYITDIAAWCDIDFEGDSPLRYAKNLYVNEELVTDLVIPSGVTEIKAYTFYGYDGLTSIEIPDSVTSIGDYAFSSCDSLTSVVIPDSVTSIGDAAFYWCTSLTSVTIPDSVTSIGSSAFEDCDRLTSVEIPDSVTSIGNDVFYGCDSLTSVTMPALAIPSIPQENLQTVIITSGDSIDNYAFEDCESLASVVIPNSVTEIGNSAFSSCDSLTNVEIPDSVTSIGNGAFAYCDSLTSVVIPDSVTEIGNSAFSRCYSLTSITVDENNQYYKSIDGNLYTKDGTTLIQYAIGKTDTSFTIPDSVTEIGDEAFWNCGSLTSVEIPDSVTSIDNYAFARCTSLTSVVISESVTSISYDAFYECISLTNITVNENNQYYKSIDGNLYTNDVTTLIQYAIGKTDTSFTIPDSVTLIGVGAFYYCTGLKSVMIPDSVTEIGGEAFNYSTSLKSVYYKGTAEEWQKIDIYSGNSKLTYATRYYYSETKPTEAGNYWHYNENGEVVVW